MSAIKFWDSWLWWWLWSSYCKGYRKLSLQVLWQEVYLNNGMEDFGAEAVIWEFVSFLLSKVSVMIKT